MGKEGEKFMYHYIEDKEFLGRMKNLCSDIMNQLKQQINNDSVMQVDIHLVGSGAKNLITQNANNPIDLDYNLCIIETYEININNGRAIKEYVVEQFDYVLKKNDWKTSNDSTSVISTKHRQLKKGNRTPFKIDLGVVFEDYRGWHRLIHNKTGFVAYDQYYWNDSPQSRGLDDRVYAIKNEHLWEEVIDLYLEKKNMYLRRNDHNHPSFIVYIETINEVYGKYFR